MRSCVMKAHEWTAILPLAVPADRYAQCVGSVTYCTFTDSRYPVTVTFTVTATVPRTSSVSYH
jgi:hypothetical protein